MPIDPITISAIIGGAQTLGGLAQTLYGKSKGEGLQRPKYEVPSELMNKLNIQQIRAMQGMDDATKQEYLKNIDRLSFFTNRVSSRAGAPQSAAVTYQQQADALGKLAVAEEQGKASRLQDYYGGLSEVADARNKEFELNKLQPYMQEAKASQALIGAGLQNLYGGLSGLGKTASQSSLADALKTAGSKANTELKDYLTNLIAEAEKKKKLAATGQKQNPQTTTNTNTTTQDQNNLMLSTDEAEVPENSNIGVSETNDKTDLTAPIQTNNMWSEGLFDNLGKQGIASNASLIPGLNEAMGAKPTTSNISVTPGTDSEALSNFANPGVSGGFGGGVGGGGSSAVYNSVSNTNTSNVNNENSPIDVSDYMLKNIKTPLKTSLLMKYGPQEMRDKATELYNSFNWRDDKSVKNYEKAIDKIFNKRYKKLEDFKNDYNNYLKENKLKPKDLSDMFN